MVVTELLTTKGGENDRVMPSDLSSMQRVMFGKSREVHETRCAMTPRAVVILNPRAEAGRVGRRAHTLLAALRSVLRIEVDVFPTERQGHATELARSAAGRGVSTIFVMGGDGTVNEALNGLVDATTGTVAPCVLVPLPLGTGADGVKTLFPGARLAGVLRRVASGATRAVDVGIVRCVSRANTSRDAHARSRWLRATRGAWRWKAGRRESDGETIAREREATHPVVARAFLNIAEVGFGGAVVNRVNRSSKRLGGVMTFQLAILIELLLYRSTQIVVAIDGEEASRSRMRNVVIANGRYFGGGLLPAPEAEVDDGLFDVVTIGEKGRWRSVRDLPHIRAGTHRTLPYVTFARGAQVRVEAAMPQVIEVDGEVAGLTPAEFTLIPRALHVPA
jgi:diacylglycerol kinase family enzyme